MVIPFSRNLSFSTYLLLYLLITPGLTLGLVMPASDLYNLEIIATDNQPCLINLLDRTRTTLGAQTFKKRCSYLETSLESLQHQQKAIASFLTDASLAETQKLLDQFHIAEKSFDNFKEVTNATTLALYDDLYFQKNFLKNLNSYPSALLCGQFLPLFGLVIPTVEHILVHMGLQQLSDGHHHKHGHKHSHKHKHGHKHACATCTASSYFPKSIASAIQIAHWGMHGAVIAGVAYEVVQKMQLCKKLQSDLIAVAEAIRIADTLCQKIEQNEILRTYLPNLDRITQLVNGKVGSPELIAFMQIIKKNTFRGNASLLSHVGNILVAHRLMHRIKDELYDNLAIVGTIDMLSGIAQLMHEHEQNNYRYTFAQYRQSSMPHICICNAWHPLSQNNHSTHTVALDGNSIGHMIITGNNGSGKSMYIKITGICIWMAQTLTIMPAQSGTIAPVADIITAMHVHDSTAQGASYFMSELAHGQECLKRIEQCAQNNELCCCLVDEFFRGTGYEKAYATAQLFLTQLTEHPNCISLTATHLHELAALAEQKPNLEAWHMAAITNDNHKRFVINRGVFKHSAQEQIFEFGR